MPSSTSLPSGLALLSRSTQAVFIEHAAKECPYTPSGDGPAPVLKRILRSALA
jgi:hypothetical protein